MTVVQIAHRFRGPTTSGNGGYCAGLAAAHIDGSAEVTLRKPPPLGTPLRVERDDDIVRLMTDETIIEARAAKPANPPTPFISLEQARAATTVPPADHVFPECFVCGPARAEGDGLRIFVGRAEGTDIYATTWTPDPSLAVDGAVPLEIMWAALDCPSAWPALYSLDALIPIVLGRLTADVTQVARIGEEHVVVAQATGTDGRKHFSSSAIYAATGDLLAYADAVWIELRA